MARYDSLVEIYREAQLRLIKIITGHTGAGTKTYYNTVLKQVEALMNQLQSETGRYINTAIPAEYEEALNETYDYFKRNNLMMKRPDMFAQIHADAVHDLAREMQFHITEGLSQAGRRVMRYLDTSRDNALRQHGLKASAVKIASGRTVKDMQKDLVQRLAMDGFLTVQYGAGKGAYQVGLDTYAAMVARSTTREAGNLARENQLIDNGYDLMIMTEHYPTCGLCATLQGRVYSISGRDKRFPPLSRAFSSGYRNVHPNCRHVMTYWVESMQSPQELREAITRSNAPFTDIRSADEKALYSKQQADSRKMRADRSQFERYRARLGSEAPKTFTQFRKLKKQGGEKWEDLQKLYRSKFPKTVDNSGGSGIIKESSTDYHYLSNDEFEQLGDWKISEKDISQTSGHKVYDENGNYIDEGGYIRTANSRSINRALRTGDLSRLNSDDLLTIQALENVISSNKSKRDILLDRYVNPNYLRQHFGLELKRFDKASTIDCADSIADKFIGTIIEEKGFVSCSWNPKMNMFKSSCPVKLEISVPKGSHMYVTNNSDESEIILNRASKFRLNGCVVDKNEDGDHVLKLLIELIQ